MLGKDVPLRVASHNHHNSRQWNSPHTRNAYNTRTIHGKHMLVFLLYLCALCVIVRVFIYVIGQLSESTCTIALVLSGLTISCQQTLHETEVLVYMIIWHLYSSYLCLSIYVHPVECTWRGRSRLTGDCIRR